ncbi:family 4 glycosyl hydrolase [Cohnella sp. 56]|uniref:family 4 glycosyl hydrolase n=1 Tax=Cohnella sp. 56 TaxID=3113722 RepID=UPI0030E8AFA9
MKLVLIGGGSFVFAPTVLEDAIVKHRLAGTLVLVDPNVEAAEALAAAGRRVVRELGAPLVIEAVADRCEALAGADFVIVSAAPQGARRWSMDYEVLAAIGLADQARECGGLGGLLNSLRAISLVLDVCADMEALCPDAMLLDVTNPMPRVVTAVQRYTSIRCAGFCNIAYRGPDGYELLPKLLGRTPESLSIVTGGLNHFAWVLSIKDKTTGEDLLPELTRLIESGAWDGFEDWMHRELGVMRRWLAAYGGIAAGAVDHHAEYLPKQDGIHYAEEPPYHGTEAERAARLREIWEIAEGKRDWHDLFNHPSWEHPVDLAVLLQGGQAGHLDILNVRNEGAIPQLPAERVIEAPVEVSAGELKPVALPAFPDKLAALLRAVSDVHELTAEAAATGSRDAARRAVEIDPAIGDADKHTALEALDRMLDLHADLLPRFAVK